MNNIKLLRQIITIAVIFFLLAACSSATTKGTEVGALTTKKIKAVDPQPGAVFSAVIAAGDKASSGALSFKISESGTVINDLRISLENANCNNMITMGSVMDFMSNPGISIAGGAFEGSLPAMGGMVTNYRFNPGDSFPTPVPDPMTVGKIAGRFTTPIAASGKITIFLGAAMSGGIVCELGTFDWNSP
jgi:hypothetical protein